MFFQLDDNETRSIFIVIFMLYQTFNANMNVDNLTLCTLIHKQHLKTDFVVVFNLLYKVSMKIY